MGDSHAAEEKEQLQAQFASKGNPQGISKLGQRSSVCPLLL